MAHYGGKERHTLCSTSMLGKEITEHSPECPFRTSRKLDKPFSTRKNYLFLFSAFFLPGLSVAHDETIALKAKQNKNAQKRRNVMNHFENKRPARSMIPLEPRKIRRATMVNPAVSRPFPALRRVSKFGGLRLEQCRRPMS